MARALAPQAGAGAERRVPGCSPRLRSDAIPLGALIARKLATSHRFSSPRPLRAELARDVL
jgi:hypothetical protein